MSIKELSNNCYYQKIEITFLMEQKSSELKEFLKKLSDPEDFSEEKFNFFSLEKKGDSKIMLIDFEDNMTSQGPEAPSVKYYEEGNKFQLNFEIFFSNTERYKEIIQFLDTLKEDELWVHDFSSVSSNRNPDTYIVHGKKREDVFLNLFFKNEKNHDCSEKYNSAEPTFRVKVYDDQPSKKEGEVLFTFFTPT